MKFVIKKPLVTEKNTILNAAGTYVFEVDSTATKTDVKKAVETGFDVKVASVNTVICRKQSRANKYGARKTIYWKKALVKLMPGEKIALFEGA